ncbi:MAG: glycosyltransferase family 4 protein [Planctomycetes bacterium]|nr:glycosyltransferase family 4 protein [Planctomycetota bacterium]
MDDPQLRPTAALDQPTRSGLAETRVSASGSPVFGFLLVGGSVVGSQVRDIRLANEFARRGYPVRAWWAMDRPHQSPLSPTIPQRWLYSAGRYAGFFRFSGEFLGRTVTRLTTDAFRQRISQRFPAFVSQQLRALIRAVCLGVERDGHLIRRFGQEIAKAQVTHFLPNLECLAPFVHAARRYVPHHVKSLVTFQGYELYAIYARELGLEDRLYERLRDVVAQSDWPAISVSDAYSARIQQEVGVAGQDLKMIPAGAPFDQPVDLTRAHAEIRQAYPQYRPEIPLVTYVGRRDSEKGIDLLLYAARLLQERGVPLQLAICGPTAFGNHYAEACQQVAWNMRLPVLWGGFISDALRSALFRASRTVVYPSIHGEPFGMVPIEAMAQGTPVVVPDQGGVAGLVQVAQSVGGLRFRTWDSGDLAQQIERLLRDTRLCQDLSQGALQIADYYSVTRMGDRVLDHMGLPRWADGTPAGGTVREPAAAA